MKFDFKVDWTKKAQDQLLNKVEYIHKTTKNQTIALTFYNEIKDLGNNLILIGATLRQNQFYYKGFKKWT